MPEPRISTGPADWDEPQDGAVSAPNARSLARWWGRSANGVLRIEAVVDGAEQAALVLLAAGGPVGLDGMEGIRLALRGGTLSFDPLEADEPGDREGMAEALWAAAEQMAEPLDPALVVMPSVSPALAESPMDERVAAALLALAEPTSLQDLATRIDMDIDRLGAELARSSWLGLTTLKEAHTLHERRQRPMPAPPAITVPKSSFAANTLPPRTPLWRPASEPATEPAEEPRAEPRTEARPEPRPDARLEPRSAPIRESVAPGAFGPDKFGSAPASASRVPAPVPISRLQREAELLRHADGWTALGIPRGAAREMVQAAAGRMRERYAAIQRDPNPDARGYATEILRRVADAERSLLNAEADEVTDPHAAEFIAAGGIALERGDFARADKQYSAARRHAPNDASVLAHLAWARFKNPEHKRPAREEEAVELIALALQFDAECAVAWRYKADIARARGDMDGARAAMQNAAKLNRR